MKKEICIVFLGNISHDSRSFKLFKSLKEAGYKTTIICAQEPGEKHLNDRDVLYIRLRKWDRAFFKILQFYLKSLPQTLKVNPNIVVASDFFSLPLAWLISIKTKAKLIYDSREFYSSLASLSKRNIIQKLLSKFERYFASYIKVIITVNQSIAKFLLENFKDKKIIVLRNLPLIENSDIYQVNVSLEANLLVYLGNFHPGRGLKIYFRLIERLKSENKNVKLLLIGKGELKEQIENEIEKLGFKDDIFITGPYSPEQEIVFPNATKVIGLCIIEPVALSYIYSLPNKVFEYIRHKIPFVASDFPEIRSIVDEYKVGISVNPQDFDEIYKNIVLLLEDDTLYNRLKNNCETALKELNWKNEIKNFYEALDSL